jgi:hypothetical protein
VVVFVADLVIPHARLLSPVLYQIAQ